MQRLLAIALAAAISVTGISPALAESGYAPDFGSSKNYTIGRDPDRGAVKMFDPRTGAIVNAGRSRDNGRIWLNPNLPTDSLVPPLELPPPGQICVGSGALRTCNTVTTTHPPR